jgi:hypothetical protein
MDAELKAKWVAALRSGTYRQGERALKQIPKGKKTPCHCCIGVLAEVLDLPSQRSEVASGESGEGTTLYEFQLPNYPGSFVKQRHRAIGMLPYDYCKSLGLPAEIAGRLVQMNDDGKPFHIIAAFIEEAL